MPGSTPLLRSRVFLKLLLDTLGPACGKLRAVSEVRHQQVIKWCRTSDHCKELNLYHKITSSTQL